MAEKKHTQNNNIDLLLAHFVNSHEMAESFSVRDAVAFVSANLRNKIKTPEGQQRLERDVELILEGDMNLFYRSGSDLCYNRSSFFHGTRFKIRPSTLEIKEGLLFYGARFAPFCTEEIFADEYTITEKGSGLKFQPQACPVQFGQIAKLFQMLGRSAMIDCIVADDMENFDILQHATVVEKALVKITAFNFAPFYHKYNFQEGDAIIVTVENWETGSFSVEYAAADTLPDQETLEAWIADLEEGLIKTYEDYGEYLEIPDQIAHAYLCCCQLGHDLRQRPSLSLEEYPALMRDITIRRDGPEWTLVPVDEPMVSGGFDAGDYMEDHDHDHECSCGHDHPQKERPLNASDFSASAGRTDTLDAMLEDISAPLDYTEIYAMIQDDLANGQESAEEFVHKLIDFMGVSFVDDAQEASFQNYIEECWEEAFEHFDPVIEQTKTPLRTRVLELNSKRLERAKDLVNTYKNTEIPAAVVREMKEFHARILNTLGLLNADSSLPEGTEYDQLELRVGDLEDAWDVFEEKIN